MFPCNSCTTRRTAESFTLPLRGAITLSCGRTLRTRSSATPSYADLDRRATPRAAQAQLCHLKTRTQSNTTHPPSSARPSNSRTSSQVCSSIHSNLPSKVQQGLSLRPATTTVSDAPLGDAISISKRPLSKVRSVGNHSLFDQGLVLLLRLLGG